MQANSSERFIVTSSAHAKRNYLYVQEIGTLKSQDSQSNQRRNLRSLLFILVASGQGSITYKQRTWELNQGDCAWIDCSSTYSHASSSEHPWELKWVHFDGVSAEMFYQQFLSQNLPPIFTPRNPSIFSEYLASLLQLHKENDPHKELLAHKYLTDICVSCFQESNNDMLVPISIKDKLNSIRKYMYLHYTEKISLDDLAGIFFISKYHLVREYHKYFNTTPANDLIAYRISHAKELLRFGSESIEEISYQCGFNSAAYFIRMFKQTENLTPHEFRQHWKERTTD